jgi:hypothetical protein
LHRLPQVLDLDRFAGIQSGAAGHPLVRGPDLRIDFVGRNHPIAVLVELTDEVLDELRAIAPRRAAPRLGRNGGSHEQQRKESEKDMSEFHRPPPSSTGGNAYLNPTQ